jgi:hypothetical protein
MQLVVSLDENGKPITLLEAFESLDITPDTLSIDRLNVSATARTFYRHVMRKTVQSPVQVCMHFLPSAIKSTSSPVVLPFPCLARLVTILVHAFQ